MKRVDAAEQRRIEELVAALEPLDDARLKPAKELVQVVLMLHSRGLAALMEVLATHAQTAVGRAILEASARDPDIAALLVLHDLHPHPLEERLRDALDDLRSELSVQGLAVRLVAIDKDVARLRLEARAPGSFSIDEVRQEIEAAVLERAPEIAAIEFDGLPGNGQVAFVPIAGLRARKDGADGLH